MAGIIQGNDGLPLFIGDANERLQVSYERGGPIFGQGRLVQPMYGPAFVEGGHSPSPVPPVETPQPYDTRASQDYGANGPPVQSTWGVESRTPPPSMPPVPVRNTPLVERVREPPATPHIREDKTLPMDGPDPAEGAGQYTERVGPIIQRIDVSHGNPHLNQDLVGVKPKETKKLFGKEAYKDFHRRDL
jgi:hypothetical protein